MQLKSKVAALALMMTAACTGSVGEPEPTPSTETPSNDPFSPAADPTDSGTPPREGPAPIGEGTEPADTGADPNDTGAPPSDPAPVDPAPPADSGTAAPPADTGTAAPPPPADTGAPTTDTAPPVVDPVKPPPAGAAKTEYAPYFYTWGWGNSAYPFTSLVDMHAKTGLKGVTLAFAVSSGGCNLGTTIPSHVSDIKAYQALGGKVKISFGGAGGTYIENGCTTAAALTTAISNFVDATGVTDLDFDVEQAVATTATVNTRRAQALAAVQKSKGIKVAFTLQANPGSGMTAGAVSVVQSALDAGVVISHVNLMTMDYGVSYSAGKKMGDLAISAVNACLGQLKKMIPGLTDAAGYQMIGATPMIGTNDVLSEVFTLADAVQLAKFAREKGLGLVAYWAIQRDAPCAGGLDLVMCTGAQTAKYQFHNALKTVAE